MWQALRKRPLSRKLTKIFFGIEIKDENCSIVCSLFQARSPFRCRVTSTNANAIRQRLAWKIASEVELPVSNLTAVFCVQVRVTTLHHHPQLRTRTLCIKKGISLLRDSVNGLIISVTRFLTIPRYDGTSSGGCRVPGAITVERNGVRVSNLLRL